MPVNDDTPAYLKSRKTTLRGAFLTSLNAILSPLVFAGVVAYGLRLILGGFTPTLYEFRDLAILGVPTMFGTWVALRRKQVGRLLVAIIPQWLKALLRWASFFSLAIGIIIGLSVALSAMDSISKSAAEVCHAALGIERDWSAPLLPEVKACLAHGIACRSAEDEAQHDKVIYGDPYVNCVRKRLGIALPGQPGRK